MLRRLKIFFKWSTMGLLLLALVFMQGGGFRLNKAEEAASPYLYDLIQWEFSNFMSKWLHKLTRSMPWSDLSEEDKRRQVDEFFEINAEVQRVQASLRQAVADANSGDSAEVTYIEGLLEALVEKRNGLRNDVEETIEGVISSIVEDQDLTVLWGILIPPVDVRLGDTPKLLVTSPRDRIERMDNVLIASDVRNEDRVMIEQTLFDESNLAALVLNIGGVATYPASIPGSQSLHWTLQIAAHEWLHHYFFFRPLGQNMFNTVNMQVLNETAADLAGREIGDLAFLALGGTIPTPRIAVPEEPPSSEEDGLFDYDKEMRTTRLRTDELLGAGMIEEAERYMEERRQIFVDNGYLIRKINQAFFAFNGTYAENPASVSPIGNQLHEFRDLSPDIGTFISRLSGISSYEDFLEQLDRLRQNNG